MEPVVNTVTICPSCLRSLVLDGEACRLATAADTVGLSEPQLARLRKARKTAREAQA
jgi:hypothetical protein